MNSILNAINTPINGTITGLGPVKVSAKYPAKATSKGSMMRTILATDGSGNITVVLYGNAANASIVDGGEYTFKSTFKRSEYNSKAQLIIDGDLAFDGGAPANNGSSSGGGSGSTTDERIARQNGLTAAVNLMKESGGELDTKVDTILSVAERFAHFSLTGEKSMGEKQDEPDPY